MAELGVGYISIVPEVSKINPEIRKALGSSEKVADKSGQNIGNRLSSGMKKTLKRSVVGVGVAAGGTLATSITKGLGRLTGIENAEASLRGLGHEASSVDAIMENALNSVTGTSYGLETAATVAASAVAAGIEPGQDLERTLKMVGDAATIAGIDMDAMGSIVNKVATSDMMQMDVANQLMDAGIPILQMVAEELGVTADEARSLASAGEVSFETFQNALENGVGGAALEAGDTVQGSFANMGAALGRFGATVAGPFYDEAAGAFGGVTDVIDNMTARVGPVMDDLASWIQGTGIPALKDFGQSVKSAFDNLSSSSEVVSLLDRTKAAFVGIFDAGKQLAPTVVNIAESLGKASAALGVSGWQLFLTTLEGVGSVAEALAPPLEAISDFMSDHPALVTTAVGAWAGFKTLPKVMGKLSGAVTGVKGALNPTITSMRDYGSTTREAYGHIRKANPEMGRFSSALKLVGGEGGMAADAMSGFRDKASGVMSAFGGPWALALAGATAAFMAMSDASSRADEAQKKLAGQSQELSAAQEDLQEALAGTTGELGEQGIAAAARVAKAELIEFTAIGEQMDGLVRRTRTLGETFSMSLAEVQEHDQMMRDVGDAYQQLQDSSEGLGYSMDDVNEIVAEGGPRYETLIQVLRESGDAGNYAADQLEGVRDSVQHSIDMVRQLDPEVANAAATFRELADSTDDAAGGADRLRIAYMELRGINMSATESAAELTKELANTKINAEELAGATLDANGAIDTTTDAGAAAFDTLNSLASSMQRSVGAGNDANEVFDQSSDMLDRLSEATGISGQEWEDLLHLMGMTPEQMEIVAEVNGDQAKMEIAGIQEQIRDFTTGPYVTKISIQDEEARDRLESMGFAIHNYDEASGTADLHVNDQASIDKLNWWISEGFPAIDFAEPTAEANLRVDGLMFNTDYAKMQLETLDLERPFPWADLDIGALNDKQLEALRQVDLLDGQTPTPDAGMSISQLNDQQQKAMAQVYDLDGERPTPVGSLNIDPLSNSKNEATRINNQLNQERPKPVANLDNEGVRTGAQDSQRWINGITGKTVSVVFSAVYRGFRSGFGGVGGSDDFADGGRVPAYAVGTRHRGYRLPKTGPGTERVDGFTAFNQDMIPAARLDAGEWVINGRSSEEYDRELREINRGTFPKLPGYQDGGRAHADEIDHFVRGGSSRGHRASRPLEGAPYQWAGINWGDCSAAMAAIARFTVGLAPFAARFSTGNQREALASMGFNIGRGPAGALRFGWKHGGPGGGHTAGTLPNGVNVEMGGARGNGQYGGNAAGADHPQFSNHAYIRVPTSYQVAGIEGWDLDVPQDRTYGTPSEADGDLSAFEAQNRAASPGSPDSPTSVSGVAGASTGYTQSAGVDKSPTSWSEVAGIAGSAFASGMVSDALGVFGIPDSPPILKAHSQWQQSQAELAQMAAEAQEVNAQLEVSDAGNNQSREVTISPRVAPVRESHQAPASQPPPNLDMPSVINRSVNIAYDPSGGVEQWRTTVEMALDKLSIPLSNVNRTLEQIDIESGGDPNAQNNWDINAKNGDPSIGLLQVIGSTFRAFRSHELPNDQRHPLANVYAGANYATDRYGRLEDIWPTRAGYATGGWVAGLGNAVADAIPAMVSNGEFVVRSSRAAMYGPLLEQINGDRQVTSGGRAPVEKHYHLHGPDSKDLLRQLEAKELAASMQHLGG